MIDKKDRKKIKGREHRQTIAKVVRCREGERKRDR